MVTVYYTWEREDRVCHMGILYAYTPPVPADDLNPPEGGIELISIACLGVEFADGRRGTLEDESEAEREFPDDEAYALCQEDHDGRE